MSEEQILGAFLALNIPINMHHFKRYIKLVLAHKHYVPADGVYTEKHHILPVSLFPEHEKDKTNLIKFPAKAHYIAHVILWKSMPQNKSMVSALLFMNGKKETYEITLNSRMYASLRDDYTKTLTERMNLPGVREEYQARGLIQAQKYLLTPEVQEKAKIAHKEWYDNGGREYMSEVASINSKKMWENEDHKEHMSIVMKEKWKDEEYRIKATEKLSDIAKDRLKDPNERNKIRKGRFFARWNKNKDFWIKLQEVYEVWKYEGITCRRLQRRFNTEEYIDHYIKRFKKGYIPKECPIWNEWLKTL